jgi:hypothetical protein
MARSKSKASQGQGSKSNRSSKSQSQSSNRSQAQESSSDEGFSFSRARGYVEDNVSLQTAGIALAGAGVLALVSSAAGRSLIRTAAASVARLATENFGEMFGSSEEAETSTQGRQKQSRQRSQDRI